METKVRRRIADKVTRSDGTSITPFHTATDVQAAINDCLRERQPQIHAQDPTWYQSEANYVGVTDAVVSTNGEQFALPADFKAFIRLARSDLTYFPAVKKFERSELDMIYQQNGHLFSGDTQLSENEACAVLTGMVSNARVNRLRILPAPVATSYTYRLFYQRIPTEPSSDSHDLDMPDEWAEVIALDTALYLAQTVNSETAPAIEHQRDLALAARMGDNGDRFAGRAIFQNVRI
jgi:hypothetical protein